MDRVIKKTARVVALISLLGAVFLVYCNSLDDLDFWWHLKAGEYICQNHTLPAKDNFSFTSEIPDDIRNMGRTEISADKLPQNFSHWSVNLTHSWLGEVIIYTIYAAGGLVGVTVMKSAVFVLTLLLLYLTMRKNGAGFVSSYSVLALVAWIGNDFKYVRPQIFSFLFFVSLVYLLCDYRRGGRKHYLIPPLMLLWANIHAGFVIGVISLLFYAAGETLECFFTKLSPGNVQTRQTRDRLLSLLVVALASFLAGLANPNGYKIFLLAFETKVSLFSHYIQEFQKPTLYQYPAYWLMVVLCTGFIVLTLRRMALAEVIFTFFLMASSFTAIRMIIFFSLGSAFFLARSMTYAGCWIAGKSWFTKIARNSRLKSVTTFGVTEILLASISSTFLVNAAASGRAARFELTFVYPTKAIEFIKENKFPPNIFNNYSWGGYLIWNLPQYPVFIDGRGINETTLFHYLLMNSATEGNISAGPLWKRLLEAYQIELVVTTALGSNGHTRPLVEKLSEDPSWELVYQDGVAIIFLKGTDTNRARFRRLFLPKKEGIYSQTLAEGLKGIERTPARLGYYETVGNAYVETKNYEKAKEVYLKLLQIDPHDQKAKQSINSLENMLNASRQDR